MLEFSKDFFKREERDGFVIEPMMKNAWAANLEVLHSIDKICKENDIPYFADWGTLLGTVRHHGYIPWDDDIDICMMRDDYKRFCQVIEQYKDEVVLLNVYTADNWGVCADKVINMSVFTVNRAEIKEAHGFPFTAGVDIFLIDYVPRDKKLEEEWMSAIKLISMAYRFRTEMEQLSPFDKEFIRMKRNEKETLEKIKKITGVTFADENPTNQELLILLEEVSGLYGEADADYLTQIACLGAGRDYYLPKDTYSSSILMPFENTFIPVPENYDLLLKKKYGDDYMTPINKTAGHDYPFYNKSVKELALEKHQEEAEVLKFASKIGPEYYDKFINKNSRPCIEYPPSFFEEEVIDNVLVSNERKRIWAAQLEVYLEVKRLCELHNITMFVIGDTLAGAIARHGYLPTSEEFHVAIMRSDYMRLMPVLQTELGAWFDYRNVYTHEHEDMRCYVFSDSYLCDEEEYRKRFHGCPYMVGIDIAAIDGISPEPEKEDTRKMMISNLLQTAGCMPDKPPYAPEIIEVANEWKRLASIDIDTKKNLRGEFVKAADIVAGSYRGACDKVRISADLQDGIDAVYNKESFCDTIEVEFASTTVPVPVGYEEIIGR